MHLKVLQKRAIHKTGEATSDLIGNNIADEITGTAWQNALWKINRNTKRTRHLTRKKDNKLLANLD